LSELSTVYDIMEYSGKGTGTRHTGQFGIEIETESKTPYDYPKSKYWDFKPDNSLRDYGVELVSKGPLTKPELEYALGEFEVLKVKHKYIQDSISTSIHVHANMLNETFLTVANFLTTWALVENLLIKYSGPDRLSNLFCLSIKDAEGILDKWINLLKTIDTKKYNKVSVPRDSVKYSALNVATLSQLGTLEVRTFRGETDVNIIKKWVEIIDKIMTFSRQKGLTPPIICDLYREHTTDIIDLIFQEYAKEIYVGKVETKKLIEPNNILYAARLASCSKNWDKFGILKIKPVYKEKVKEALDLLSKQKFSALFDQLQYHERLVIIEDYQILNTNVRIVDASSDI